MNNKKNRRLARHGAALLAAALSLPCAADWRPDGYSLQLGSSFDRARSVTVGAVWDLAWQRQWRSFEASALVEGFVSAWRAPDFTGGHQGLTQIGVLPVLRLRPDGGRSRWFFEAGIGLTTMDRLYVTPTKQFTTRFNFFDMLGVGYSFDDRQQELGLRYAHISNADIRKPNPGEDFLLLRYARRF